MYTISWTNFKRLSPLDETPGLLSCLQWPGGPNSLHPNTPPTCWWCESLIVERCWTRVLRFFSWLPVHIFFLLSMYLLIMFTLAVALCILYLFILCFSYICTLFFSYHLVFDFPIIFFYLLPFHSNLSLLSGCFPVKAGANANLAKTKGSSAPSLAWEWAPARLRSGTFLQIPFARGTFW